MNVSRHICEKGMEEKTERCLKFLRVQNLLSDPIGRKYPVEFSKAKNSELFSVDGERYIDFLAVAGSMNYGHNNPEIKAKLWSI